MKPKYMEASEAWFSEERTSLKLNGKPLWILNEALCANCSKERERESLYCEACKRLAERIANEAD